MKKNQNKLFLCEKNTWRLDIARAGYQNSTYEEERFKKSSTRVPMHTAFKQKA